MIIDYSQYQFLDQPPFFIGVDHDATDVYSDITRKHLTLAPNVEYAIRHCGRGTKAIDLGANVGHFTLPLSNQGVSVLAVEALPVNYVLLCQSVAKNRFTNTIPVHAAIHSSPGVVSMSGTSAWAKVSQGTDGVLVPSMTFDDLCGTYNFWDASLVKIDIEGSELAAFHGAERFMRQNTDAVFLFEANAWATQGFNYPVCDLLDHLVARGYSLYMFEGKNLVPRTAQFYQEGLVVDYLACRSAAPPLVAGFVSRPLTWEERIQITLSQATGSEQPHRAYTLAMAPTMPHEISSDPRVQSAIRQIDLDLPDDFRRAAAQIREAALSRGPKT